MEGTVGVVTQFLDSNIGVVATLGKIALALAFACKR